MKQLVPPQFPNHQNKRERLNQLLRAKNEERYKYLQQNRFLIGAVSGLMLCVLGLIYHEEIPLIFKGKEHQIQGVLFMDANGDRVLQKTERTLAFAKLNLYADINENQLLDDDDLPLGSCITNAKGEYDIQVAHGRTLISRVRSPKDEVEENSVSGSVRVGSPVLSLGGDGGVSKFTTLHFENISLPADADIKHAYLRLRSTSNNQSRPLLWIYGTREQEYTKGSVFWECGKWKKDHLYQSPDLSNIILSLIEQSEATDNSSIGLVIEGDNGSKEAYSSAEHAPQLVIHYEINAHPYLFEIDPSFAPDNEHATIFTFPFKEQKNLALPFPGMAPTCLSLTKDGRMASLNWQSGMSHGFSPDAHPTIDATQLSWMGSSLYGLYQQSPGKISVPDGSFQKIKFKGPWPGKSKKLTGLAAHPYKQELWAIQEGGYVIQLNPQEETLLFHTSSLVPLTELAGREINHMVVHVLHHRIYLLVKSEDGGLQLMSFSLQGEDLRDHGPLLVQERPLKDVLGLSVLSNGKLMLITGQNNSPETNSIILELDPQNGTSEIVRPISNQIPLGECGCLPATPHRVGGQVFHDRNGNGKREATELAYPHVRLQVFEDRNQNGEVDLEDFLLETLQTDQEGQFSWQSFEANQFLIVMDTASLPAGIVMTSDQVKTADFRGYIGGGSINGLSFAASQKNQLSDIFWAKFQVEEQDGIVNLHWITTREEESGYFYILRSGDGYTYETIGRITAQGPSSQYQQYDFHDRSFPIYEGKPSVYRLRWENIQGQTSYSKVVRFTNQPKEEELRLEVSPGSHRPLDLRYRSAESGKARLQIINLAGKTVFRKEIITSPDWRQLQVANHDWTTGIYYIQWEGPVQSLMKKVIIR